MKSQPIPAVKQYTALERLVQLRAGEIRRLKCSAERALEVIQADGTIAFGTEFISLPDGTELEYTNTGDTYSEALCRIDGGTWFLSTWGACLEAAEADRYEETGESACCCCGEYAELHFHEGRNWSGHACPACRGES